MLCTYSTCQPPIPLLSDSFRVNCFSLSLACDMRFSYPLFPALLIHPFLVPHFFNFSPLESWPMPSTVLESVCSHQETFLFPHRWRRCWHSAYYSDWFLFFTSGAAWNEAVSQKGLFSLWLILYTGHNQYGSPHVNSLAEGKILFLEWHRAWAIWQCSSAPGILGMDFFTLVILLF